MMKYLKQFEKFLPSISFARKLNPNSPYPFTYDEMEDVHDMFQDISHEYNIIECDNLGEMSNLENAYLMRVSSLNDIYMQLYLYKNSDDIIDSISNNFFPQLKSAGYYFSLQTLSHPDSVTLIIRIWGK